MKQNDIKKQHTIQAINKDNLKHTSGWWSPVSKGRYFFNNADNIAQLTNARYTVN